MNRFTADREGPQSRQVKRNREIVDSRIRFEFGSKQVVDLISKKLLTPSEGISLSDITWGYGAGAAIESHLGNPEAVEKFIAKNSIKARQGIPFEGFKCTSVDEHEKLQKANWLYCMAKMLQFEYMLFKAKNLKLIIERFYDGDYRAGVVEIYDLIVRKLFEFERKVLDTPDVCETSEQIEGGRSAASCREQSADNIRGVGFLLLSKSPKEKEEFINEIKEIIHERKRRPKTHIGGVLKALQNIG